MKPAPIDIDPPPHHRPKLVPLTALTAGQIQTVYTLTATANHRPSADLGDHH